MSVVSEVVSCIIHPGHVPRQTLDIYSTAVTQRPKPSINMRSGIEKSLALKDRAKLDGDGQSGQRSKDRCNIRMIEPVAENQYVHRNRRGQTLRLAEVV